MSIAPPPPKISDYRYGAELRAGLSAATIIADIDFETYSPEGFIFNAKEQKYEAPPGASKKKGLISVGVARYVQNPNAEVLSCAYDLKDGKGARLWTPAKPLPLDLFDHLEQGNLLEAWNSSFEAWVWEEICVKKYGWPALQIDQLRCAAAKSRAYALPPSLADAGDVLNTEVQKEKDGKRLLNKFSIPRNPTKHNSAHRRYLLETDVDTQKLYSYNIKDIEAEAEISSKIPDLSPEELEFWQLDQRINRRGVQVDLHLVDICISIAEEVAPLYNAELNKLTKGAVPEATLVAQLVQWLSYRGLDTKSLAAEALEELLERHDLAPDVRRALEIRDLLSNSSFKKLYALKNRTTSDGRLYDLFLYHAARTGRATGRAFQPQNLPKVGSPVAKCKACGKHADISHTVCPWCSKGEMKPTEWKRAAAQDALEIVATGSALACEIYFGRDVLRTLSGCIRSLLISKPGCDLICSDYSAIEAVVLAALAGEEWRLEVFRTHGKNYEMSAAKITGVPFEQIIDHKKQTGEHHPLRSVGKVAELASGYQGAIGAWKRFGADEHLTDDQIKQSVKAWRRASPAIVAFWGNQYDGKLRGCEGCAINSVMHPGVEFAYRGIKFLTKHKTLYITLLSGRHLTYHNAQLTPSSKFYGQWELSYEGYNTNSKMGGIGWIRMTTYGGRLTENIVQGTARDILAYAIVSLEKAGYPVVLHVHDEIVCEVPEGFGSVEEFETIMSTLPAWAAGWPVRAEGGWRGKRYGK